MNDQNSESETRLDFRTATTDEPETKPGTPSPSELSSIENSVAFQGGRGRRKSKPYQKSDKDVYADGPKLSASCIHSPRKSLETTQILSHQSGKQSRKSYTTLDLELEEEQRPDEANSIKFHVENNNSDCKTKEGNIIDSASGNSRQDYENCDFHHGLLINSLATKLAEINATNNQPQTQQSTYKLRPVSAPFSDKLKSENSNHNITMKKSTTPLPQSTFSNNNIPVESSLYHSNSSNNSENQVHHYRDNCKGNNINMDVNKNKLSTETDKMDFVVKRSVSCGTQTEWSWFDDFNAIEEYKKASRTIHAKQEEKKNRNLYEKSTGQEQNKQFSETSAAKEKSNTPSLTLSGLSKAERNRIMEKSGNKKTSIKSSKLKEALKTAFEYNSQSDDMVNSFDESESEDDQNVYYDSEGSFLPSVGPPQILQYQRESDHSLKSSNPSMVNVKHSGQHLEKSLFSGPCQFCGKQILPLPTLKEVENLTASQLYCCLEYENFIKVYLAHRDSRTVIDEMIDIAPHAPYGTKAARKAAKERAAERMREKELDRQKVTTAQVNFFSFTRQVKTIQYQLSSPKCMEEGWTIRPSTPVQEDTIEEEINFDIELNSSFLQKSNQLYEKFYDDGRKFLTIFPDGTGCLFYPSGSVAVMIISSEPGKYTYIIQKNSDEYDTSDPGILALFEPNGNGTCYFKDGSLRLVLTPHSGIQFDKHGNKKKRWQWYFIKGHVHTPPFQPICFTLNKQLSVRLMEQDNLIVTFTCSRRAVRFNVGVRLKVLKSAKPPSIVEESDETYLKGMKQFVGNLVNKIQVTLRFPNSPKLDKLTVQSRTSRKLKSHEQLFPKLKEREASVTVN